MNTIIKTIETIQIEAYKLKPHLLLRKLGLTTNEDMAATIEFFANESKTLGHYSSICVTKDFKIISQPEVWEAAKMIDDNMKLTVDILDIEDDDLIRFINAKSLFHHRVYASSWALIRELRKYLEENPKGKIWFKELNAGDIIQTLSKIIQRSQSTIKEYQAIGKYADENPSLNIWDRVGNGEGKLSLKALKAEIKIDSDDKEDKAGEFPLDDEDRKKQQAKQEQKIAKMKKQNKEAIKRQGKEFIQFEIRWKDEGKVFKGQAITHSKSPDSMLYYLEVNGINLIDIVVNVPEVFKRVTNNPINLKNDTRPNSN